MVPSWKRHVDTSGSLEPAKGEGVMNYMVLSRCSYLTNTIGPGFLHSEVRIFNFINVNFLSIGFHLDI